MREAVAVTRLTDPARAEELLALVQATFGALDIDPPSGVLKETAADFAARLQSETCFVIEQGGRIVASVFCIPQGDALYIGRLAVAPDQRRRGLAGALVDAAKREARRLGAKRVTLRVRISLADNVALFQRHGFAIVAEDTHAGYPGPTQYAMELMLAG
ncbi:MAG: GNAT family N-acetyltransferase [Proteobacteria bacterium]|nr:GNAT family N-acetyltransferase [Pseudomonadota bacterium]